MNRDELFRILQEVEIPCVSEAEDGRFTDLRRLDTIQKEIENSGSRYHVINGKNNYYKLYGQEDLETIAKEFDQVILVSSHADNLQSEPRYEDLGKTIRGIFDNACTNAVCTYIMEYHILPKNVLFAFTADEEKNSVGALKLAKKLKKYFGKGNVSVIVLDVTYGWQGHADFTLENDFIYKKYDGERFIKIICNAANESGYSWKFLKTPKGDKTENLSDYIPGEEIAGYMQISDENVTIAEGEITGEKFREYYSLSRQPEAYAC